MPTLRKERKRQKGKNKRKGKKKKGIPPGRDIHSFSDPATLQLFPFHFGI